MSRLFHPVPFPLFPGRRTLQAQPRGGSMKSTHAALAAAALLFAASGWAQHGDHKMVSPSDLKWSDVPSLPPGAKIAVIEGPMSEPVPFTVRLKFPANYQISAHWHPAVERVTVLTGTFHMGIGDKLDRQQSMALSPGSIMIMQPKTNHFACTAGEEVIVQLGGWVEPMAGPWANHWYANLSTYIGGIPGFFMPRAIPWGGMYAPLGVYSSSWYRTEPLHATLAPLIDFELLKAKRTRLTVGAVNVKSGELRYFDNTRDPEPLALEHVMASGALPPAFPAIAVDGEPYWDGGIYSNTPIEAVLDDHPRRDSVIFSVNVWQPAGPEPQSIWDVLGRQKNIQYASRADSHIARHKQIHRLRHIIRKLSHHLPEEKRDHPDV